MYQPTMFPHFFEEQWVGRQFEGFRTMRLQAEGLPNPTDGPATEPGSFGQLARAPVRLPTRRILPRLHHNLLDLVIVDLARRSRPRLVREPFQTCLEKPQPPFAHQAQRAPQ